MCDGRDFEVKIWVSFKHKWRISEDSLGGLYSIKMLQTQRQAQEVCYSLRSQKNYGIMVCRVKNTPEQQKYAILINYTKKVGERMCQKFWISGKRSPQDLSYWQGWRWAFRATKVTLTGLTFNFLPTWTFRPYFGAQLLVCNRDIFLFKYNQ